MVCHTGSRERVLADDSILVEASYNGIERIDRYTKDGAPLPGWGTNGSVDLETVTHSTFDNSVNQTAADLDAQGRIVIGYERDESFGGPKHFYALRLNADGTLDTAFGASGSVEFAAGTSWIYGIGFEADGRIIFGINGSSGQIVGHLQP